MWWIGLYEIGKWVDLASTRRSFPFLALRVTLVDLLCVARKHSSLPIVLCCSSREGLDAVCFAVSNLPIVSSVTLPNPVKLREAEANENAKLNDFQQILVQMAAALNGDHRKDIYPDKLVENMTIGEAIKYCEDAFNKFLAALKSDATPPDLGNPKNVETTSDSGDTHFLSEEIDSACSTPYVSAPSSPGRVPNRYLISAPASSMHFIPSSSPSSSASSSTDAPVSGSFEFEFSGRFPSTAATSAGSMISADELFLNGQIRSMKLSVPDAKAGSRSVSC
ncbi:hypothetical protein NE237_029668 [Protea cynaroides]|uniref:Uncharacterized protein n=1 Tax=Protea cynaroides TaxID=273540 RepID=A0A9Q0GRL3_9MAGN|nr:hypothetical protein NE237_029668 [Protea cynaroides]